STRQGGQPVAKVRLHSAGDASPPGLTATESTEAREIPLPPSPSVHLGARKKNSGIENVNNALLTLSIVYTSWVVGLIATPAGHTRPLAGPLMTPRGGRSPLSSTLHTPMNPVPSGSHGDGRLS